VYLCSVVYYAVKAEPAPEEGGGATVEAGPDDSGPGTRRRPLRGPRPPHGGPARTAPRTRPAARAYAERR
jgi:hypothetical protein